MNLVTELSAPHAGLQDDPDVLGRLEAVILGRRPADAALLADVGAAVDRWARAFGVLTPTYVLGPMRIYVNCLVCITDGSMSPALRAKANGLLADTALLAGLLTAVSARFGEARAFYGLARDAAREAGDDTLVAHALAGLASLYSSIPHGGALGDPRAGYALVQQAVAALPGDAPAASRAFVHAMLAVHAADAGEDAVYDGTVDRADDALAEVPRDGRARSGFIGAQGGLRLALDAQATGALWGRGAMLLGRAEAAVVLGAAVHRLRHPGTRADAFADLARLHIGRGEIELACRYARSSIDEAREAAHPIGVWCVRALRTRLDDRADHPAVHDLDDHLKGWP